MSSTHTDATGQQRAAVPDTALSRRDLAAQRQSARAGRARIPRPLRRVPGSHAAGRLLSRVDPASPVTLGLASAAYLGSIAAVCAWLLPGREAFFADRLTGHPRAWLVVAIVAITSVAASRVVANADTPARVLALLVIYLGMLPAPLLGQFFGVDSGWYTVVTLAVCWTACELSRALPHADPERPTIPLTPSPRLLHTLYAICGAMALYQLACLVITIRAGAPPTVRELPVAAAASKMPTGYAAVTGAYVAGCGPTFLALARVWRSWRLLVAALATYLTCLAATGSQMVLVVVALALVLIAVASRPRRALIVPVGLFALTAGGAAVDLAAGRAYLTAAGADRLVLAPGTINAAHFSYFADSERLRWLYTLIGRLAGHSGASPGSIVGHEYFGPDDNASANFIGDGFANAGHIGTFILFVALGLIFWAIDVTSRHVPAPVAIPAVAGLAWALTTSSPLTAMASGGGTVLCLVLFGLPWVIARARLPQAVSEPGDPDDNPDSRRSRRARRGRAD